MGKISVLIADDHAVLRAGLKMLIQSQKDMAVVGEAATAQEALQKVVDLQPDLLTLDINMPGMQTLKLMEQLTRDHPNTRVLVLTMHDDPAYLRAALAAGAAGYLVKTTVDTQLITAIRTLHAGKSFIDPCLAGELVLSLVAPAGSKKTVAGKSPASQLSDREREVLVLLAQGHTQQEIANRLFLSVKTIETYRARVTQKLGLKTRADLIRYAIEMGLLTGEHHPSA